MANLKQRLHKKNSNGTYDVIHLECDLSNVTGVLAPEHGGTGASEITDVTPVEFTPYVHPTEKQCNYSYTHPTTKQCNYSYTHPSAKQCDAVIPDISNYYTKQEIDSMIRPTQWTLGATILWDNKWWLVCNINNTGYYLIAKDIISLTWFGDNYYKYAGSNLASVAASYQRNNMSAAALAQCVDVTVPGQGASYDVTAKVFVPSYEQMNGGFSWFDSNEHRIAYYNGGVSTYWTSSDYMSMGVWYVNIDGILGNAGSSSSMGFRPCVCVQL